MFVMEISHTCTKQVFIVYHYDFLLNIIEKVEVNNILME